MTVIKANETEIERLIAKYPHIVNVICLGELSFTLIAFDENGEALAFLSAFYREIPAPLGGAGEIFINVIDVFDKKMQHRGIGTMLVKKAVSFARELDAVQLRAYCEIGNTASHMLWLKNGFGISPVKDKNGVILGSFVTCRIQK